MIIIQKSEDEFENLDEGRLCLSYVNTSDWHASEKPDEGLNSYGDLVRWARITDLISSSEADHLLVRAKQDSAAAEKTLAKARNLREAAYRIFFALAHQNQYESADLELINAYLGESLDHLRLLPSRTGFTWGWESDPIDLDIILWPVLRSTVDLLASAELAYVKICADDRGCGWAFLDLSRNHNRRWCSMESCGNRAKARRHYQRVTAN
jgi:predicted RNA-binding Zn ribbon-like protein